MCLDDIALQGLMQVMNPRRVDTSRLYSMLPVGIDVRVLNKIVNELRELDLWAERHSYSIRIMHKDMFVASLHLYPGYNEAVLRLYGGEANKHVQNVVRAVLEKYLPNFRLITIELR